MECLAHIVHYLLHKIQQEIDIIHNDANLEAPSNSLIKERFDNEYLQLFLKTTVN